ncbi:hypothetical protein GIB67_027754 [Kingdonia uniflora]|uniref:Uncharacterized protein n=1 Tax=Kingdonia uniflora TaxID=39325 RepID=A0A7J7PCZ5_9MAGN|nr:hypothetical protein GIB67_027754 [Kingdonia uniflora]
MVKKKANKRKMKLIDEIGEDDVNPINVSDNEYLPPKKGEIVLRHIPFPMSTYDLRDMWAQGDKSYPMRTHFYIKLTDVVREMVDKPEEYIVLDENDINYIISPKEIKEKNTTPIKATPVKTNAKIKIKPVVIETPVNIVPKSKSECDDIDEEQKGWVRYAQVEIDCLGPEDGYYNTHSSDDDDYVHTAQDLDRGNEFEGVDVELDNIYIKEEDDKVKTPLTVGLTKLEPPYVVDPPQLQRGRRRPKKKRIKGNDEVHKEQKRCGKCGSFGYNKKTCKGEPIQIQRAPTPKAREDHHKGQPEYTSNKPNRRNNQARTIKNTIIPRGGKWKTLTDEKPLPANNPLNQIGLDPVLDDLLPKKSPLIVTKCSDSCGPVLTRTSIAFAEVEMYVMLFGKYGLE